MDESLLEYAEEFGDRRLNEIDKFRTLRDREYGMAGLGFVFTIVVLVIYEVLGYQPESVPFPNLILYTVPLIGFLVAIVYYARLKTGDTTYYDVVTYEVAKIIETYSNGNLESAYHHIESLEDEVTYAGCDVVSDDLENSISEYYNQAKGEPDRAEFLNDSLEDFIEIVVDELDKKSRLRSFTTTESTDESSYEFDKYNVLTVLVLLIVLGISFMSRVFPSTIPIGPNTALTIGMLILSAIIILKQ